MNYKLLFAETFDEELSEIELYLRERSDQAAQRVLSEIRRHLLLLKRTPYMYPEYFDRPAFRMLVIFRYLIFYKVNDSERAVEVRHILHGMREVARLLSR